MTSTRSWRSMRAVEGPFRARVDDIPALNVVFSDAFTERYRRDGMVGVRVPALNPAIWRYAIEDAGDGAMLWRDERGEIAAFNVVHRSGLEGWMGPLAVRPASQAAGTGKEIVRAGLQWLKERGARVIGLETMPRTMDNIGFYSALGFVPGRLTITLTLESALADRPSALLGRLGAQAKDDAIDACHRLADSLLPGYDFTREIQLTDQLTLGDTLLLYEGDDLVGFALCHTAPLVEGRARDELRVLKLVVAKDAAMDAMLSGLADYARRSGTRRVAIRVQGEYSQLYARLVSRHARVRWTDLRMTAVEFEEPRARQGIVLSNWEI
jgi:GNAT superfamily N-acetyltransferase